MAAWFLLSACGFYPVCPGKPEYVIGAPLFDKVILALPAGKHLTIMAEGNTPEDFFVSSIHHNSNMQTTSTIQHADLMQGDSLTFKMTSTSSTHHKEST